MAENPASPPPSERGATTKAELITQSWSGAGMDFRYVGRFTDRHMTAPLEQMKTTRRCPMDGCRYSARNDLRRLHHIESHFIWFVCGGDCGFSAHTGMAWVGMYANIMLKRIRQWYI